MPVSVFMILCNIYQAMCPLSVPVWLPRHHSDIEITAREIQKLKKELYTIIADHSGQPFEKVERDSDRDYWMTSEEAREYGMIDEVLVRAKH